MNVEPLILSFQVASLSLLISGVLGVALAGLLSQSRLPGRNILEALVTAPLVLPPTVLGYYLLLILGRNSTVGHLWESVFGHPLVFTKTAAIIAGALAALPFIVKSSRAAMEDVDPRIVGAAATLGASPLKVFWTIILPLSTNGITAGLTLGFARALGDFGVTLMIAGNIPGLTQTGSLAIYDAVQANRHAEAAGMVAVLSAVAIAALFLGNRLTQKRPHAW